MTLFTGMGLDRDVTWEGVDCGSAAFEIAGGSVAADVPLVLMGVAARHWSSSAKDREVRKPSASNKPVAFKHLIGCPSVAGSVPVPSRDILLPYFDKNKTVGAIHQLAWHGKMVKVAGRPGKPGTTPTSGTTGPIGLYVSCSPHTSGQWSVLRGRHLYLVLGT